MTNQGIENALGRLRKTQRKWEARGVEARLDVLVSCATFIANARDALIEALVADGGTPELERESGIAAITVERLTGYARMLTAVPVVAGAPIGEVLHHRADGVVHVSSPTRSSAVGLIPLLEVLLAGNAVFFRAARPGQTLDLVRSGLEQAFAAVPREDWPFELWYGSAREALTTTLPSPDCDTVLFFGGHAAGVSVQADCDRHGKKCFLELEAADTLIVTGDAEISLAASSIATAFDYDGLPCISPRRIFCATSVYDPLIAALRTVIEERRPSTAILPLPASVEAHAHYASFARSIIGGAPTDDRTRPSAYAMNVCDVDAVFHDRIEKEVGAPIVLVIRYEVREWESVLAVIRRTAFKNRLSLWSSNGATIADVVLAAGGFGQVTLNARHTSNPRFGGFSGGTQRTGGPNGESALFWRKTTRLQTIRAGAQLHEVLAALGAARIHHRIALDPIGDA